jgi:hypothetical protein
MSFIGEEDIPAYYHTFFKDCKSQFGPLQAGSKNTLTLPWAADSFDYLRIIFFAAGKNHLSAGGNRVRCRFKVYHQQLAFIRNPDITASYGEMGLTCRAFLQPAGLP